MTPDALAVLRLRQNAAKSSVAKYPTMLNLMGSDGIVRNSSQFAGASRTGRDAGRGIQPTNITRTPKILDETVWLDAATDAIRAGDMDALTVLVGEPMTAIAGCVRSAIAAPDGYTFRAADLNAIEPRLAGWLAGEDKLLDVFRQGLDPYKVFASRMLGKPYEAITRKERNDAKPGLIGASYRLGSGMTLPDGRKTGLLAYAEGMGVYLSQDIANLSIDTFRTEYRKIKQMWYTFEEAGIRCIQTHREQAVGPHLGFVWDKPFLKLRLPPGRFIHYMSPEVTTTYWATDPDDEKNWKNLGADKKEAERLKAMGWSVSPKENISYMGKPQNTPGWNRIITHGGKFVEQSCQATARDVLKEGIFRATSDGFDIRLRVYDELLTLHAKTDRYHTHERLAEHMAHPVKWAEGLPLAAEGWTGGYYRK